MTTEQYWVYFRGQRCNPYNAQADMPFSDIYAARRAADYLCDGYPKERHIYVVQETANGLVNVGLCGWNRKPFINEAAA